MRISKLSPSARAQGRWLCQLEDGTILRLGECEVLDFGLYAGRALTEREVEASVRDMIRVQQLLLPTSHAKRTMLQGAARLLKKDYVAGMVMPARESLACRQKIGRASCREIV